MSEFNITLKDITSFLDECDFCEEYQVQDNSEEWQLIFILKQKGDSYPVGVCIGRIPEMGILLSALRYHLCDKESSLCDFIKLWNNDSNTLFSGMRLKNDKNMLGLYKFCLTDFGISKNTLRMEIIMLIDTLKDIVKELREQEILDD